MTRISLVPVEEMDERVAETAKEYFAGSHHGVVPNTLRTLSHRPEVALAISQLGKAVMSGTVDQRLRCMIAYKVSVANDCPYCVGHTGGILRAAGFTPEEIAAIENLETGSIDRKEELALRFAEQTAREPQRIPDTAVDELKEHFTEGEIVEIAVLAGYMTLFNKVNDALGVPLEDALS